MPKWVNYKGRKCCMCGSPDTYIDPYGSPKWRICSCGRVDCSRYICDKCNQRYNPDSIGNIIKSVSDWRIGQLDPNSNVGKGFIGAQIVAKTIGVDDCNIKMNNFNFYIDLSEHLEYGKSQVKIATFNKYNRWQFSGYRDQDYDFLFLVCMDDSWPWKNVERIYAIPWEAVGNRQSITVYKDSSRRIHWYAEFRIDEKPFDDTYHKMELKNCRVLRRR